MIFRAVGLVTLLGTLALIVLWWTAADESRAESRRRLASVTLPDLIPTSALHLHGDIKTLGFKADDEMIVDATGKSHASLSCDALCAALLASPDVTSVTIAAVNHLDGAPIGNPRRFRLRPRAECPVKPAAVIDGDDRLRAALVAIDQGSSIGESPADPRNRSALSSGPSLQTAWNLRLASRDCIVVDRILPHPDFTIVKGYENKFGPPTDAVTWNWTLRPLNVGIWRIQILDGQDRPVFRKSHAVTSMLAKPLFPSLVGFKDYATPVFGWARYEVSNDPPRTEFNTDLLLLQHTDLGNAIRAMLAPADTMDQVRKQIEAAVNDKSVDARDPAFALIDVWMRSLSAKRDPADLRLLTALIADPRVTQFQGMWKAVDALGADAAQLRRPILQRIARDSDKGEIVKPLAAQLPRLPNPPAVMFPEESALLNDPQKRLHAKGLIIAQAARGETTVALLLKIMRQHAERSSAARRGAPLASIPYEIEPVDAVQVALCRIGPAARAAVPELRGMTREGLFPASVLDDRNWKIMLARVGTPIEEIEKLHGLQMTQQAYEVSLRQRLANFNVNRDCAESSG